MESLKVFNAQVALAYADEMEDAKGTAKMCFYMFWKHNWNANFSYLGDAYAAEEAKCLQRLAEEEAEAAAKRSKAPEDPQDPQA